MNPNRLIAIILIVAGVAALAYGGFSYTKESHDVKLGPIEFSLKEKKEVSIPTWAGIAAVAAGVALLMFGRRK